MFNLIRRISGSVIPRQDRPWSEDATSNAPHKRKRRRSWDDPEQTDRDKNSGKRSKAFNQTPEVESPIHDESGVAPTSATETEEVRTVTKGVKDVELEDKPEASASAAPEPHTVPLPADDDKEDLLDVGAAQTEADQSTTEETAFVDKASSEPGPSSVIELATVNSEDEESEEQESEHLDAPKSVNDRQDTSANEAIITAPEVRPTELKQLDVKTRTDEEESQTAD